MYSLGLRQTDFHELFTLGIWIPAGIRRKYVFI